MKLTGSACPALFRVPDIARDILSNLIARMYFFWYGYSRFVAVLLAGSIAIVIVGYLALFIHEAVISIYPLRKNAACTIFLASLLDFH